ncbi:MAG: lactate racemase domain-containing protein, partial [Planctomycetota bacterium]
MTDDRHLDAAESHDIGLRMGRGRLTVSVPATADVLRPNPIPALMDPAGTLRDALRKPHGTDGLRTLAERRRPKSVVITMSDITRPVPNKLIITAILAELALAGIPDTACTILIATGMHRPDGPASFPRAAIRSRSASPSSTGSGGG